MLVKVTLLKGISVVLIANPISCIIVPEAVGAVVVTAPELPKKYLVPGVNEARELLMPPT